MCGKPKIGSDLETEPSKNLTKSNFTCMQCVDKEHCFKTQLNRVYCIDFSMQLHYLLVIVVSDVSVIFATN